MRERGGIPEDGLRSSRPGKLVYTAHLSSFLLAPWRRSNLHFRLCAWRSRGAWPTPLLERRRSRGSSRAAGGVRPNWYRTAPAIFVGGKRLPNFGCPGGNHDDAALAGLPTD